MALVSPERIKRFYGLWYKYLSCSDNYRNFCDAVRVYLEGTQDDVPEDFIFELDDDAHASPCIWFVYKDQWGDIFQFSFDEFWSDHQDRILSDWSEEISLVEQANLVTDIITNKLNDRLREGIEFEANGLPLRPEDIQAVASEIVLKLEGQKIASQGLGVSHKVKNSIKLTSLESDMKLYESWLEAKHKRIPVKKVFKRLKIPSQRFYEAIGRVKSRIRNAEQGYFPE